jgi:hypothetical protein
MLKSASGRNVVQFADRLEKWPPEECYFYHVTDLPGHGTLKQEMSWDLRGRFDDYLGGVRVKNKSFLDVGTASGFMSFEAERHGAAEVYSFDADSFEYMEYLPYTPQPLSLEDFFDRMRSGYWFSHRALKSKAQAIYGNIIRWPIWCRRLTWFSLHKFSCTWNGP